MTFHNPYLKIDSVPRVKNDPAHLAIFGHAPAFEEPIHVGRPNVGDRTRLMARLNEILDNNWLTNNGPMVREFEDRIAAVCGAANAVALCNATVALEVAVRAAGLSGEVIVPAYTFVATAHALQWLGIRPVFCDIDPETHNIHPEAVRACITPRTTGIIGVHVWGRGCCTAELQKIADEHNLVLMYDAAHAFGCTVSGRPIGTHGLCEVFSFHATKFLNAFEGGAVVTNDDAFAHRVRLMRNFGFAGYDNVVEMGTNGKMSEPAAAMGLTGLECVGEIVHANHRNYRAYCCFLEDVPGLSVLQYDEAEANNFQYIVVQVDPSQARISRDTLVEILHAENVLARKYFWPGVHRMEPYCSLQPEAWRQLPNTEAVAARVMVLPTGQSVSVEDIEVVCGILRTAVDGARGSFFNGSALARALDA
jgi:dTDP-4-amino-4,6-dideoxygalactose transaminase